LKRIDFKLRDYNIQLDLFSIPTPNAAIDRAGRIERGIQVLDDIQAHSAPVESLVRLRPPEPFRVSSPFEMHSIIQLNQRRMAIQFTQSINTRFLYEAHTIQDSSAFKQSAPRDSSS